MQWYNLFNNQDHQWWWELYLQLWSWDKAKILPVEEMKFTKTEKGMPIKEQSQEHVLCFFMKPRDCGQRIHPTKSHSQFHILLWCFVTYQWKSAKTMARTLWTWELVVPSWQCTCHTSWFTRTFLTKNNVPTLILPHPPSLPDLKPFENMISRMNFENGRTIDTGLYMWKKNTSMMMVLRQFFLTDDNTCSKNFG